MLMISIVVVTLTCKTVRGLFNGVAVYNRDQRFNYSNLSGNNKYKYTCV